MHRRIFSELFLSLPFGAGPDSEEERERGQEAARREQERKMMDGKKRKVEKEEVGRPSERN